MVQVRNGIFAAGTNSQALRTLNILFACGSHGDSFPFDAERSWRTRFTRLRQIPSRSPATCTWTLTSAGRWVGANIDLFSVVLHETGHALGLGHTAELLFKATRAITWASRP